MRTQTPYQFFLEHAGYCYNPAMETMVQGRQRGARALAKAERIARNRGYTAQWVTDPSGSSADWIAKGEDGGPDREPWAVWGCILYDQAGVVQTSLWAIDFGREGTPYDNPYRRVVEAELALEVLSCVL